MLCLVWLASSRRGRGFVVSQFVAFVNCSSIRLYKKNVYFRRSLLILFVSKRCKLCFLVLSPDIQHHVYY